MKYLCRLIQHIYPLDIRNNSPTTKVDNVPPTDDDERESHVEEHTQPDDSHTQPLRRAAVQARDQIIGCLTED